MDSIWLELGDATKCQAFPSLGTQYYICLLYVLMIKGSKVKSLVSFLKNAETMVFTELWTVYRTWKINCQISSFVYVWLDIKQNLTFCPSPKDRWELKDISTSMGAVGVQTQLGGSISKALFFLQQFIFDINYYDPHLADRLLYLKQVCILVAQELRGKTNILITMDRSISLHKKGNYKKGSALYFLRRVQKNLSNQTCDTYLLEK